MSVSNLDALIREAVCGESSSSSSSVSSSDKNSSASSSVVQGNSLKRRLPSTDNFNSGNNGINSLLSSSLDFVKADAFENPLYDALEQNPKIIHVSKNAQMFRSFSYFSRNNSSSSSATSNSHNQQHPVNGVKKELHNGKSPSHVQDDIPAPKFNLFQGRIDVEWRSSSLQAGGGLHNQGNTCFLNSVLQCLAYTAPLYNVLVEENHSGQSCRIQNQTCMLCEIQKTLKRIFDHPQNAISPNGIVGRIREIGKCFHPGRQEDAHEFLIHLFDSMQKACLHNKPKLDNYTQSTSLLHQIFGGFCRSQVICSKCHNRSNTYDPFLTLSIDVQHCNSIKDSLARYTKKEFLGNANMYKCEKCKQKVDATRRVTFQRLPKILVLHLKRFNYNGLNMKLSKHLNFPDKLELNSFLSESVCKAGALYNLYAVLVHSGFSSHSGHYYCFVKSPSGIWYKCNDSHVSKCSLNLALQSEAYMLFYSQKPQQNLKNGTLNTSTSSTSELSSHSSESVPLNSSSFSSPKVKPQSLPKQKLSSESIPNGLSASTSSSNEPPAVTFPKVGANYNHQNSYKDHNSVNQGEKPKLVPEPKPVASVRPTLSFKIPKRTELNEANDAKNSKMLQKANENLLQRCGSSTEVSLSIKQSETRSPSSDGTYSSSYDRLHPFASSGKIGAGGDKAVSGETQQNGHADAGLANSSGANGLVPYSFADDSDGSDSDDVPERAKGDLDGPPLAKVPKKEVSPKPTSQLANDDNSSSISSNLSFLTSSSGSNSENNLCTKPLAGKESSGTTNTTNATTANHKSPDNQLPGDVTNHRKEGVSISLPCSPRLQDSSRTARNNFDFVHDKGFLSVDKKSSHDVDSKEGTLTISTNGSMFEETMSDINGDARSPSVSSNDSKSSMGSSKKISHLQKLKEKVKSVKQKIKSNKPTASSLRRNPSTIANATKVCFSEDENAPVARDSPRRDVATSPHVDHNYVTRTFSVVSTSNNKAEPKFQTPRNAYVAPKQNATSGILSAAETKERSGGSPKNDQQQARVPSQPVCVPRKGMMSYGQFGSTNISSGISSQSLDVVDRLNQQAVTKSWNGNSSLDSSKKYFSYANNNNNNNNYDFHSKSRQYDEIDSELDRGHNRKRKSHESYGHSYGYDNGYTNGGGGPYKGYNNNNYWYGNKPEQRHVNKFQHFHENRGKNMGGYYGNSFSNRYRGRGANQHYR